MKTLVLGASGATGKYLVKQLLEKGRKVKAMIRSEKRVPEKWKSHEGLTLIETCISKVSLDKMQEYIRDCDAIASCLGHNLSFKGIYGKPRKLVTNAIKLTCQAVEKINGDKPVKIALMNTAGNSNRDLNEPLMLKEKLVTNILRLLLPPHTDNEEAADYLRKQFTNDFSSIEWVVVRPDSLIDENEVTEYEIDPSPIRSALFNPGKTSRINVGHFMAQLLTDEPLWKKWKGQMPVIYNR